MTEMTRKTAHLDEPVHNELLHIQDLLRKGSANDTIKYLCDLFFGRIEKKQKSTSDAQLESKYPCTYRAYIPSRGIYFCHQRGHGLFKKLPSLRLCGACKDRIEEKAYRERQRDITKAKIHALQLKVDSTIQRHKDQLYPTCNPLERQGEYGYEIRSEKCPNKRIKDEWHPSDLCPLNCPYLKRIGIKKKVKAQ